MKPPAPERLDRFLQRPYAAVWTLAAPMMAGMLLHAAYSVVDTVFIGRLGSAALAGVTFVGPIFFAVFAISSGLGTGITAAVAQAAGRRDKEGGDRVASAGFGLAALSALAFLLLGHLGGPALLRSLGAQGESLELAWDYLGTLAWGFPLLFLSASLRAVLTGEGDARTPMVVLGIGTLTNLALDPLFMFGLGMGIRGAAVATLVAQGIDLAFYVVLLATGRRFRARLHWQWLRPGATLARRILGVGLPTAASQLVMALGSALGNRVVAHFGQRSVAGYGAATRVDMIVAMPIIGLAAATVALVGMFAGAGRADLVRKVALHVYRWVTGLALVLGAAAYFGSSFVLRMFSDDPQALAVGAGYLAFMVFGYPLMGIGMTSGRILQGLGHGLPALVITGLRVLGLGIPLAYVAVYVFDAPLQAIWASFLCGGLASVALALYWVRRALWLQDPTLRARA